MLKAKAGALAILEAACERTHHEAEPKNGRPPDPLALLDTHLPCTLAVGSQLPAYTLFGKRRIRIAH